MNILILNWRDPKHPLAGGAEIALLEHAKYWQKKGANILWFGSSFPNGKTKEKVEGINYLRCGSHYTVHFWAFLFYLQGKFGKIDIVIDCFHFLPFFTPLYMKNTKIIALIHEVAKDVWFKNLPLILAIIGSNLEPLFFKFYKNISFITVSQSTKKDLEEVGIISGNIKVIENGTHIPKVKKITKSKDPVILFLGRITQDKGIKDAIDAYENIFQFLPKTELWIAGKEQEKGYLKTLLKSKNIKVLYYGFVSEKKKYELLQHAWLMVHPSTREGWGLTVIEANSMGTPVVGYDVPGLKDSIQNEKTGLLVKPNSKSLAEGIIRILGNNNLYINLSKNALEWSRKFDWGRSTQKSWEVIQGIYK